LASWLPNSLTCWTGIGAKNSYFLRSPRREACAEHPRNAEVLALHPIAARLAHTARPPADFVAAAMQRAEAWRINDAELRRAEWFWLRRPRSALFRSVDRHPFLSFVAFTAATLAIVALLNVLVWAACFAAYPLFVYAQSRRFARWQRCYRQALGRILQS
jgi:Flp pilus assembly protein TadB